MATVTIRIPNVLRHHTDGLRTVDVPATTVGEAMDQLFAAYPTLSRSLVPKSGNLFESANLFLNSDDVEGAGGLAMPIKDGDSITILPAMAGGGH